MFHWRTFASLLLFQSLYLSTVGQFSINVDSLITQLDLTPADTNRVNLLNEIADGYGWNDAPNMLTYADSTIALAEQLQFTDGLYRGLITKSSAFYVLGKYDQGIATGHRALKLAERENNEDWIGNTNNSLGLLYQQAGKLKESKAFFDEAINIFRGKGMPSRVASSINNKANSYYLDHEYEESLSIRSEALQIRLELGDSSAIGDTYNDLGETYAILGQLDSALYYLHRSLDIKQSIGDLEMVALSSLNLGKTYLKLDDLRQAEHYLYISETHADSIGALPYLMEIYNQLATIKQQQGDLVNAYAYLQNYTLFRDSLISIENERNINRLSKEFETEKKELQIQSLEEINEREKALSEERDARNNLIIWFVSIGLGLVIVFTIFLFNRFQITQKQKSIIESQKDEVEHQKELVEEKNKEITDSILYAKRLQEAILPPQRWMQEHLPNSFVLFMPKDIVSGDFYWMESFARSSEIASDGVFFAAADCTGHGVPGAMVSVVGANGLNRCVNEFTLQEPRLILDQLTDLVIDNFSRSEEEVKDGMDIALCCLTSNADHQKVLQYAGANNPLYLIRKGAAPLQSTDGTTHEPVLNQGDKRLYEIKATKQPIGQYHARQPFEQHELILQSGDACYVFSDGFADQFGGPKGKKFKYKPFKRLLMEISNEDSPTQHDRLQEAFEAWRGQLEQVDDVCVIGVRI